MRVNIVDSRAMQPYGPIDSEDVMQERVASEVGRPAQRIPTFEQLRAADRKMIFLHQQFGCQTRILAAATANGDVDSVADKIRESFRRRHPHVDIAVGPPKTKHSGHEPSG